MATLLMDEIVEEVLFRIPPDDPLTLVRAALVCKQWRRISSDPVFRRRFRDFHGAPPMLGVLCNINYASNYKSRFIPTSSFRSRHAITSEFHVVDAQHGRVLLRAVDWACSFAVWDPIRDKIISELPATPPRCGTAAVVCAAGDFCDHHHCEGGPFHVVYIGTPIDEEGALIVYEYNSEDGVWRKRDTSSSQRFRVDAFEYTMNSTNLVPSELIGNALHFVFGNHGTKILKYDLTTSGTSVIHLPMRSYGSYGSGGVLTTTEEGGLGFASVEHCNVHLWSWQQPTLEEEAYVDAWHLTRVVELPTALPAKLVGFSSGVRVLFYTTSNGIHAIDLKSSKTTTISKTVGFYCVFPYMTFYPF